MKTKISCDLHIIITIPLCKTSVINMVANNYDCEKKTTLYYAYYINDSELSIIIYLTF